MPKGLNSLNSKNLSKVLYFRVSLDMMTVQSNSELSWESKFPKLFWRGRDSRRERLQLIDLARKHPELINTSLTNFFFFRDEETIYGPKAPHVSFFKFFDVKEFITQPFQSFFHLRIGRFISKSVILFYSTSTN